MMATTPDFFEDRGRVGHEFVERSAGRRHLGDVDRHEPLAHRDVERVDDAHGDQIPGPPRHASAAA